MPCDLVLEISPGDEPDEYRVDVNSPAGTGTGTAHINVDALLSRRREVAATVLASAVSVRGAVSPHELPVRQIGTELFEAVFADRVYGRYTASMQEATNRSEPLRVILRLRAPELAGLPWETMFDPETDEYLCQREPVVRFVEVPQANAPLLVEPPLRILGLVAAPSDLAGLDVAEEKRRLSTALAKLQDRGKVELVWADGGSWPILQSTLLDGPWHVVHFIGHGGFDESERTGVLALEDGVTGRSNPVSARKFAHLLRTSLPVPRLVVLNSCQSGEAAADDLLSSTAAELVRSGTSATVAMQFAVTDAAALAFSGGFYEALARNLSVEEAVRNGRIAIEGTGGRTLEWLTPVLYSRTEDTRLFALQTARPRERPKGDAEPGDIRPMYLRGLAAARAEQWDEAITLFDSVLTRFPDYEDAAERRDEARHALQLAVTYDRARTAESAGQWRAAAKEYAQILQVEPSYRDAAQRRDHCDRAARIALLEEQIRMLDDNEDWPGVLAASRELESLDPAIADVDGLATRARRELHRSDEAERTAIEHNRRIAELRQKLTALVGQQDWRAVLPVAEELLSLDATDTDARNFARTAEEALQREQASAQAAAQHAAIVRQLQERMQALGRDQDWRGVLALSEQLKDLDSSAADVDGIATMARAEVRRQDEATLAAAARSRHIADLQQTMRKAARKHQWQKVLKTSGELARLDPALADTEGLATQADEAMRLERSSTAAKKSSRKSGRLGNRVLGTSIVLALLLAALWIESGIVWMSSSDKRGAGVTNLIFGIVLLLSLIPLGLWLRRRVKRTRSETDSERSGTYNRSTR